jgi:alginate O-acetyltransferase complex protein AlgI
MLFNSYAYIFCFLPLIFIVYFFLNRKKLTLAAKTWLTLSSFFFYGYWNPRYLPLIAGSILFNYVVGSALLKFRKNSFLLILGVLGNLGLLIYFKYMNFFITSLNTLTVLHLPLLHIVLPIGISFFTFTQIAYLVDTYNGSAQEYSLINYALFVTFFPHLLAGPIIHHKEIMPQFDDRRNKVLNYRHIAQGLSLFSLGLFKKVIIADTLAIWANNGFDYATTLTFLEAWATSLSFTLQLYFDFSGYTDMALGSSLLLNIQLPINFNSPYKALSVQDFWRRWHITLSRFMRDYVYIPLGGNRVSEPHVLFNLLFTFLLIGLWHGAGWTFVVWGLLHGCALILGRLWKKTRVNFPKPLSWFLTFNFVNAAWVFFRARTFTGATKVLTGMVGMNGIVLPEGLSHTLSGLREWGVEFGLSLRNIEGDIKTPLMIIVFLLLSLLYKNSNEWVAGVRPNFLNLAIFCTVTLSSILFLSPYSEYLYFRF